MLVIIIVIVVHWRGWGRRCETTWATIRCCTEWSWPTWRGGQWCRVWTVSILCWWVRKRVLRWWWGRCEDREGLLRWWWWWWLVKGIVVRIALLLVWLLVRVVGVVIMPPLALVSFLWWKSIHGWQSRRADSWVRRLKG
jgi:hypothetical protein